MKKIYYGRAVYDNKEINAVINVLKNHSLNLIDGPHVKKLENADRPNKRIIYPIAILLLIIFGYLNYRRKE